MSLPNLIYFYRRRLRARALQELFALLGIAVGVALLFAVQVSNTSLSASIVQLTGGVVGTAELQLVARDQQGMDERLVTTVEQLDSVRVAAPLVEEPINVIGPRGERAVTLFAADTRLVGLGGELLSRYSARRLSQARSVVLPADVTRAIGLNFGEAATLQVRGRTVKALIGGVVDERDVGAVAGSPVALAALAYAQTLTGLEGRVSRIYVEPMPGRRAEADAAMRRIAGDRLDVKPADADSRVFAQAAAPNNQSTALFAGISAIVGFLFAFNATLLMSRERRRVTTELRMDGFAMRTVIQVLMFDAFVLGAVGSLAGLFLGDQISRHVFQPEPGYLSLAFPVGTARVVPVAVVLLAFVGGIVASLLATFIPLRSVIANGAVEAVDDDRLDHGSSSASTSGLLPLVGLASLAGAVLVLAAAPEAAMIGMLLLTASVLSLLPSLLRAALAVGDRLRRRIKSVVPTIAIGELRSNGGRSVALTAIAAIAVFGSTSIEGARGDLQRGLDADSHELNAGPDLWVSAAGTANQLATTSFDTDASTTLERVPEVARVDVYRGGFLDLGDRRVWVVAPPRASSRPIPPSQIVDGDLALATRRVRAHGWATISETLAESQDLEVGSSFVLAAPRPTRFRVAAITTNLGWTPGAVILNADDYRTAWDSAEASAFHVALRDDVTPEAGRKIVEAALGPASGLTVSTAGEREARQRTVSREGLVRLTQIATLVLIAAALAMAAAMGGVIWQRRRRLAELKLAGIDDRRLWKALLLESAVVLGTGCSVGAVYGVLGQQLLDRGLAMATGFPVQQSIGLLVALTSLVSVAAVAIVVTALPGYLAARVPADAAFQD